jgi:hypothetical protein
MYQTNMTQIVMGITELVLERIVGLSEDRGFEKGYREGEMDAAIISESRSEAQEE